MEQFLVIVQEFQITVVKNQVKIMIQKPLDERMASTIRHNRARGSHDVELMSNIIKELHEIGRSDKWISIHLGMDRDEILRLKQITGLTALFKDVKFGKALS